MSSIFSNLDEVYLDSLPNWSEIMLALDVSSAKQAKNEHFREPRSQSLPRQAADSCKKEELAPSHIKFTSCHSLLNLLNRMPKGYLCSKSFSLLANCILNLEQYDPCLLLCFFEVSYVCDVVHLMMFLEILEVEFQRQACFTFIT